MSAPRICRTADEAYQAGYEAPCDHGIDPVQCPKCCLTEEEIGRLAVLLRPLAPQTAPLASPRQRAA